MLAGGFALLIALVGWSDQIRGTHERIWQKETAFLETYETNWYHLRKLIRPMENSRPEEQLRAILHLLKKGVGKKLEDTTLLTELKQINSCRDRLRNYLQLRYWLVFWTSIQMLFAGSSLQTLGSIADPGALATWSKIHTTLWLALSIALFITTAKIAFMEDAFENHLELIEDSLRSRQDATNTREPNKKERGS